MKIEKNLLFLLACILLAVIANIALFKSPIGIFYSMFILVFYTIFFWQQKKEPFTHKRISGLLIFIIGALSICYFIYSNPIFNVLNYILIPILILAHTIVLTSPSNLSWHTPKFLHYTKLKLAQTLSGAGTIIKMTTRSSKRNIGAGTYNTGKKITIGLIIAFPLLFIVVNLLLMADAEFANLFLSIPNFLLSINLSVFWDLIRITLLTLVFLSYLLILRKKRKQRHHAPPNGLSHSVIAKGQWDSTIVATVLICMNLIYLLFTIVQFQYFFSGGDLTNTGLTYAEYARRGFFELLVVTLINFGTLATTLRFMKMPNVFIKIQWTLLILFSGIMLTSAFMRLLMYEEAYGYTYARIFAHAAMIYLIVIFAFSLLKVWIQRLSLARFYIIFSLLFYVGINLIGIDEIIVSKNIERYEQTGKIDYYYLERLSSSAVPKLTDLYQKYKDDPDMDHLRTILMEKERELGELNWYSYNLSRERAKVALREVNLEDNN
ncbi:MULTISPECIES: DUF4153 domain-containing protein [Bacillaceae]|uniref:DUF4173 domain-containing protein n=1 Tax=Evansella alkalicola TaxID=745819 RepID=A0ABS6JQT3_9BACI|nr:MULTISPECIES: DUF4173 domain-containing protein [Bacillaceae]MBU9720913.1 DUF4173 domain-containing protein [Bacillus alkalicola]